MQTLTTAQVILIFLMISFSILVLALPWRWGIAITPLFIFLQRFNIPLPFGRTVQIAFIVLPILYIKIIVSECIKQKSIIKVAKEIFSFKIVPWLIILTVFDLIYTVFSINHIASMQILFIRVLCYSTAFVMSFWIYKFSNDKSFKLWLCLFILFYLINSALSLHQWYDCTHTMPNCGVWRVIDNLLKREEGFIGAQALWIGNSLFYRTFGTFMDANLNAMFFLGTIPVIIFILINSSRIQNSKLRIISRFFISAAIFLLLIALFITNISRSALLGFLFVTLFLIIYFFRTNWKVALVSIFTVTFLGLVLALLIPKVPMFDQFNLAIKTRLEATNEKDPHIERLKEAFVLAQKTHFLGIGVGSYETVYNKYYPGVDIKRSPHSTFGLLLVEQGIPGLVIHLSFMIWFLSVVFNRLVISLKKTSFLSLPFVEYIFAGTFYFGFYLPFVWYWAIAPEKSNKYISKSPSF